MLLVAGLRQYLGRKLHGKVNVISKKYLNHVIEDQVFRTANRGEVG
jgi:hypothetical protein